MEPEGQLISGMAVGAGAVLNPLATDSLNFLRVDGAREGMVLLALPGAAAPPTMQVVSGSGLDAKVQVGAQTVSFDGQKVVFGK